MAITKFNNKLKILILPLLFQLPLKKPIPLKAINKTNPRILVFFTPICYGTVFKWGSSVFKSLISKIRIRVKINTNRWNTIIKRGSCIANSEFNIGMITVTPTQQTATI